MVLHRHVDAKFDWLLSVMAFVLEMVRDAVDEFDDGDFGMTAAS